MTNIEQLQVDALNKEFPTKHKLLYGVQNVHSKRKSSLLESLWHTNSSRRVSNDAETCEEPVYNREIVYDEEAAKRSFQQLVNETPNVYGWNATDCRTQMSNYEDFDDRAYTQFKNIFTVPTLTHRPSVLTDFDESGEIGKSNPHENIDDS